jgi:anti-repressor protein
MAISNYEKLVTQPLVKALEEQKPLVDFANKVTSANNTIDMGKMAKLLHEKNNIDIGRNRLFEILRNKKILMSDNTPYQTYIERNWFKVIETTKDTQYGTKVFTKVLVTGSGQLKITDIILGEFSKELVVV